MRRMLILARSFSFLIFTLHISITEVLPSFATALRRVIGCTVSTVQWRIFFVFGLRGVSVCIMNFKKCKSSISKVTFQRLLSFMDRCDVICPERFLYKLALQMWLLKSFFLSRQIFVVNLQNNNRNWNNSYIHKLLQCVFLKIIYSYAVKSFMRNYTFLFTLLLHCVRLRHFLISCSFASLSHIFRLRQP